jgi:hypothetical protein
VRRAQDYATAIGGLMKRRSILWVPLVLTTACGAPEEVPTDTADTGTETAATDTGVPTETDTTVDEDTGVAAYVDGMTATTTNGTYVVALTLAGGATTGEHDATLVISKLGAAAAAQSVTLSAWMPAHGHGTDPVEVTESATPGTYDAPGVNFKMPGRWDITVVVDGAESGGDAIFRLDVQAP